MKIPSADDCMSRVFAKLHSPAAGWRASLLAAIGPAANLTRRAFIGNVPSRFRLTSNGISTINQPRDDFSELGLFHTALWRLIYGNQSHYYA
jgi:hypothetical protein